MRVTTDFWVSALMRRVFSSGGFAAVARKGAPEAGAVFILVRSRFGAVTLFGPAPQANYDETRPSDRIFTAFLQTDDQAVADARIEREARFDSDLWLVEIEADDALVAELIPTTP